MGFTWADLAERIMRMDPQQLNTDVTVGDLITDEFSMVTGIETYPENGVLDKGHPYLTIYAGREEP